MDLHPIAKRRSKFTPIHLGRLTRWKIESKKRFARSLRNGAKLSHVVLNGAPSSQESFSTNLLKHPCCRDAGIALQHFLHLGFKWVQYGFARPGRLRPETHLAVLNHAAHGIATYP